MANALNFTRREAELLLFIVQCFIVDEHYQYSEEEVQSVNRKLLEHIRDHVDASLVEEGRFGEGLLPAEHYKIGFPLYEKRWKEIYAYRLCATLASAYLLARDGKSEIAQEDVEKVNVSMERLHRLLMLNDPKVVIRDLLWQFQQKA